VVGVIVIAGLLGSATAAWHVHSRKLQQRSDIEHAQITRDRAELGSAAAQAELGHLYAYGLGVPRDPGEAAHWYGLAADQGNARGEAALGAVYYVGFAGKQDYGQAFRWYQKAAEQNFDLAEYWLGTMYLRGYGTPQNDAEAFKWYSKAANQGYPQAEYAIAWTYRYGRGIAANSAEARFWYVRAADHGDPNAREVIAVPFTPIEGIGVLGLAAIGFSLCLGYPRPLSLDSDPRRRRVRIAGGALIILISAFNWYGYAHREFRNFPYGVTPLTFIHWLSAAGPIAVLFYLERSRRRAKPDSVRSGLESNTNSS